MAQCRTIVAIVLAMAFGGGWALPITPVLADAPAGKPAADQPPADTPPAVTAEVLSVRVTRPMSAELARAAQGAQLPATGQRNTETGSVEVLVAMRVPGHTLVPPKLATTAVTPLRIESFIDDKHNDLFQPLPEQRWVNQIYSNVTNDGSTMVLAARADKAPAPDASRILIRGVATLRTTSPPKTSPRQKLALRIGQELNNGPFPMTVQAVNDRRGVISVTLSAQESLERVKSLTFYDAEGKPVEASFMSRNDQPAPQKSSIGYRLPRALEEVQVEVSYTDPVQVLAVPVEIRADLGDVALGAVKLVPEEPKQAAGQQAAPIADNRLRENIAVAKEAREPPVWPRGQAITFPQTRPAIAEPPPPADQLGGLESIRLLGINVSKAPAEDMGRAWPFRPQILFQPFGGTVVRMMLTAKEDQGILSIDTDSLRITRFTDDTGAELSTSMPPDDPRRSRYNAFSLSVLSDTGRHALLEVPLAAAPSGGATRFALRGTVEARLGKEVSTVEKKDWPLKLGSSVQLGDAKVRIASMTGDVARSNQPHFNLHLKLISSKPTDQIRSIEMWDAKGVPVDVYIQPFQERDVASKLPDDDGGFPLQVQVERDVQAVTLKVTYYESTERVTIPLNVSAGIGL